ncbi:MAG: class I SAM-dependent methyltransferase [Candidatus Omnitrophota bacterium]
MITWLIQLGKQAYYHPIISRLLRNWIYCLRQELKNCSTVLDLGCGNNSPLQYCSASRSVGVESFLPYLEESRKKGIHSEYLLADLKTVDFPSRSFDAVLLLNVIEHLEKEAALVTLEKAERIAARKVIVTTPRGFVKQEAVDNNALQRHRSGWEIEEMRQRGYRPQGMNGLKVLRASENLCRDSADLQGALCATVRFRPKLFWLFITELSQIIAYYFPRLAFEVFYVKET